MSPLNPKGWKPLVAVYTPVETSNILSVTSPPSHIVYRLESHDGETGYQFTPQEAADLLAEAVERDIAKHAEPQAAPIPRWRVHVAGEFFNIEAEHHFRNGATEQIVFQSGGEYVAVFNASAVLAIIKLKQEAK